jgi:hypothetical protein
MNKDGLLDFAIGNKNGVFYFEQIGPLKPGEKSPTSH